ncbi:MAG TPA: hypothetical protein VD788_04825 [Candidatus Polarisedimenticolaceae bacterium]|nr:hypothetical protein [Candidatus Polarisedimenticolaceae bacterium]
MGQRSIPPETYLDLRIHLDRVSAAQKECFNALGALVSGDLSVDDYRGLVDRQSKAQQAWVERHQKYFGVSGR